MFSLPPPGAGASVPQLIAAEAPDNILPQREKEEEGRRKRRRKGGGREEEGRGKGGGREEEGRRKGGEPIFQVMNTLASAAHLLL